MGEARTGGRLAVIRSLPRRAVRRLVRPITGRYVDTLQRLCDEMAAVVEENRQLRERFEALSRQHAELAEASQAVQAFGWDYAAMVRRLAAIEDRLELGGVVEDGEAALALRSRAS